MDKIMICSAVVLSPEENLLMVRKKGSAFYQLPGGKIEEGETFRATVVREFAEELDLLIEEHQLRYVGTHQTSAVNERDTLVEGHIFLLRLAEQTEFLAKAELDEVCWISKQEYPNFKFAHLADEFVVPKWLNMEF